MSNLLNNGKPRKKLLDRGPKIVPAQEFKLEETAEVKESAPAQEKQATKPARKRTATKTKKQKVETNITSVRVTKSTRNKLNALIQLGKADSVDVLLDTLLDEYIENSLAQDEQKIFDLFYEVIQKRDQ